MRITSAFLFFILSGTVLQAQDHVRKQKETQPPVGVGKAAQNNNAVWKIGSGNQVWKFDETQNTWIQVSRIKEQEVQAVSIMGESGPSAGIESEDAFLLKEPENDLWVKAADYVSVLRQSVVSINQLNQNETHPGRGYFYNDYWQYDPSSDTWNQTAAYPGPAKITASNELSGAKQATSGLEEQMKFNICPNHYSGKEINSFTQVISYEIFDLNGRRTFRSSTCSASGDPGIKQSLNNGFYYLKVMTCEGINMQKLAINKVN